MIDGDKALENLRRGVDQVAAIWSNYGRRHSRVEEILDLSHENQITWGLSEDGRHWSHRGGPADGSEIRVLVLVGNPARETQLLTGRAVQTFPARADNVPTVFVGRASFTTLWAGLVLCHELDHALEYRDGVSVPWEAGCDWESAEGRVHRHEAALLDGITDGRFVATINGQDLEELLAREPVDLASELMATIPPRLRQPHRSAQELWNRRGSVTMSAAIVAALGPSEAISDSATDVNLGEVFRRAREAWS